MTAAILTISIFVTVLFFLVGGLIGWVVSQHISENKTSYMHPEFFDRNGNIIPDEILALRFEGDLDDYYENEESDEDS
jgi:hypothetical protein